MPRRESIFGFGHQEVTRKQIIATRKIADDSFCTNVPRIVQPPFVAHFLEEWEVDEMTGIALTLKCVDPHTDTWTGFSPIPRKQAALFWLFDCKAVGIHLQVANESHHMRKGDWVFFDDTKLHSVTSNYKWLGVAYSYRYIGSKKKEKKSITEQALELAL